MPEEWYLVTVEDGVRRPGMAPGGAAARGREARNMYDALTAVLAHNNCFTNSVCVFSMFQAQRTKVVKT